MKFKDFLENQSNHLDRSRSNMSGLNGGGNGTNEFDNKSYHSRGGNNYDSTLRREDLDNINKDIDGTLNTNNL